MKDFKDDGIISTKGKQISILEPDLLLKISKFG